MEQRYKDWIEANVAENGYGQCKAVTEKMAAAFPELTRVRGHYYCLVWGERAHWWLTDQTGNIVDPTVQQFPTKCGEYVPWDEGQPEPTGLCLNCGDYCYDGKDCCSDGCYRCVMSDLMSGL